MVSMKALVVKISFFESFFKVHYTKGFRLTYPIPLPTTVAGMFGAFLGIEREKLKEEFNGMLFGSKIIKYSSIASENATFLQYKSSGTKIERGATSLLIVNEPSYFIAIAGEDEKIKQIKEKISNGIEYIPYGGQNDFFVKDWRIICIDNVEKSNEISNYAPQDMVQNTILEKGSEIQILPVRHKLSENPNFYFVINGKLKLKENIPCIEKEKIGLYELDKFQIG